MATSIRRTASSVEDNFLAQAYEYDFHQAVNLLESLKPNSVPFGEGSDPEKEAFSIQSEILQSPPSSDIHSVEWKDARPVLRINFLGIAGIQGPLPMPFTELIFDRIRHRDTAPRDYLDIFNTRLAALWHRMRKKIVLGVAQVPSKETPAGKVFLDLIGLESQALQGLMEVPDNVFMGYAGLIWQKPRNIIGLQRILGCQYAIDVSISQFHGQWRWALSKDYSLIGKTGQLQILGQSMILGKRSWDQSARMLISTPPLSYAAYIEFLEGGPRYKTLCDLVYFYCGASIGFIVKVSVDPKEIPPTLLGRGFILGRTTWLTRGEGKGFRHIPYGLIPLHLPTTEARLNHQISFKPKG